ncbi:MAG: ral nucleoside transport system permease protein [Thermococcaceae archaeon]|uniref:ABC transporter permease n=1 Tax=unclassified Thermococcus TaxID=2627626 RepID=UPI0005B2D94A|nr:MULTISPECIES: ABC transporter permease [unclassified Thermococcus]KUK00325.1 MAG: ABC-type transport system, permease component [Thermococcales archaeon 44_46]MDK2782640.1 ral nucleoside transport system permease protein [Thermococcaceae archaeon]MDN5320757.1 ral nucleoside transport system permease protein [Thermococcaceae archaeon]MPW38306.1 ABC transporter permease [Thermococcus sp. 101 C5]HIH73237.1 ABC transporter permease [Thermococcaceae archaeon]
MIEAVISILIGALTAMVPLVLTSVGATVSERAGVVNIGYEGIILMSAFFGAIFAEITGNPWIGLIGGAFVGMLLGMLHGFITVYLKGDHVIPGIGVNLLALGVVAFGITAYWGTAGQHQVPTNVRVAPIINTPYGSLSPMVLITIAIAILTHWVLFRTPLGLRIRAVGENPEAADALGINVERYRFLATVYGAMLAGLGGAFMSVDWLGTVTKQLSAGRGFIALANMVFSGWNPLRALLGGFIFGFFDNLSVWVRTNPEIQRIVPWQFVATLPYLVTLIIVAGIIGKVRPPKADGKPYKRE